MTTGKRQIPINDHDPGRTTGSEAPDPARMGGNPGAARGADPAGGAGTAQAGASQRSTPASHAAGKGAAAPRAAAAKTADEQAALGAERDALVAERDTLVAERDALADSRLRLQAEFENFRRRASRELVEARTRAQADLLNDLLPVLDNLERALDAAEHHEEGKVLDGVRLTRNMFTDLLARAGVEEIEGVGAQFDPQIHDAMTVQPSEHDEGIVAAVLERGYRQGERVLRPARVVVSAGPGATGAGRGAAR